MATLGDMTVRIVGDNSEADKAIDKTQKKMENFAAKLKDIGKKLTLFVTAPILGIATASVKAAADMQMMQVNFATMLGSGEKARKLLGDLKKLAAFTPFGLKDLAQGTKTLLQFGIELEDVLPTLEQMGDISLGNGAKMQSLALAFGQMSSTGRLMGQDLLQMINVGFNPLQVIAKKTGETMAELKERMSKGAIGAEEVADAFRIATAEGGQFYNGMKNASSTLTGRFSTLKDTVVEMARSFGAVLLPAITKIIEGLTRFIERFASMEEGTKRTIITIGLIAAAVGPAMLIISKGIKVIQGITKAVKFFQIAGRAAQLTTYGLSAANAVNTTATLAGTVATGAMTVATQALAIAQTALPILAVIAGLTALAAIAIRASKETKELRLATEKATEAYEDQIEAINANNKKIPDLIQRYDELSTKQVRSIAENRELIEVQNELVTLVPGIIDEWGLNADAIKKYNIRLAETNRIIRDEAIEAQDKLKVRLEKNQKWFAVGGLGAVGAWKKAGDEIAEIDKKLAELDSGNMKDIVDAALDAELTFRAMEISVGNTSGLMGTSLATLREEVALAKTMITRHSLITAEMEKQKQIAADIEALRIGFVEKADADIKGISNFITLIQNSEANNLLAIGDSNRSLEEQAKIYQDLYAKTELSTEAQAFYYNSGNEGFREQRKNFRDMIQERLEEINAILGVEEEKVQISIDHYAGEEARAEEWEAIKAQIIDDAYAEELRKQEEANAEVIALKEAREEAWIGLTQQTVDIIAELIKTANDVELAGIEEIKNAKIKALDEELQATLKKYGLEDKTRQEQIKEELKDLDGKLTEEERAELNSELKKLDIIETYDQLKADAEEEAAAASRRIVRDSAIAQRVAASFSIAMNTAQAVMAAVAAFPITAGMPFAGIATGLGLAQEAAVWVPPLPPLAAGGIVPATPGGRAVQVAEAGQAEAIFPLDKLDQFLSGRGEDDDVDGGIIQPLILQIETEPIYTGLLKASRNRIALIDAGGIV